MEGQSLGENTILHKRYKIDKVIGQGGFGITYLARDIVLNQTVVVKEYFPGILVTRDASKGQCCPTLPEERDARKLYEKGKKDFLSEARRMSQLFDVQAIVKILNYFEENDTAYLVMEYVKGISLERFLEQREVPFDFDEAWKLLEPVVQALEKVHKKGIIHRDLNPSNLIVTEEGTLRIIDFGAARKYLDNEKTMTILVKQGYAPPEQYMKKEKQGPWTDVYAVCVTLYEMVTGVRPEPSINRLVKDELYLPSSYGTVITPDEESVLARGMEPDCHRRIQDMRELQSALHGEGSGKPDGKRRKTIWILSIAAALTVIVFVTGIQIWQTRISKEGSNISYAGNYGRGTDDYKEFVKFTEEHAVSREVLKAENEYEVEREGAILYTLLPEAVKEWGEPCNALRLPLKEKELLESLKDSGYLTEKEKKTEEYTVEIQKYGGILTRFIEVQFYKIEEKVWMKAGYDSVNQDLIYVFLYTQEGEEDGLLEPGADILEIVCAGTGKSREETADILRRKNALYQSHPDEEIGYQAGRCFISWEKINIEGYNYGYYFRAPQKGSRYYWP